MMRSRSSSSFSALAFSFGFGVLFGWFWDFAICLVAIFHFALLLFPEFIADHLDVVCQSVSRFENREKSETHAPGRTEARGGDFRGRCLSGSNLVAIS